MREKEERSEEERVLLHFIAQSLTSCTDQYRSTKRDERPHRACACMSVCMYTLKNSILRLGLGCPTMLALTYMSDTDKKKKAQVEDKKDKKLR